MFARDAGRAEIDDHEPNLPTVPEDAVAISGVDLSVLDAKLHSRNYPMPSSL